MIAQFPDGISEKRFLDCFHIAHTYPLGGAGVHFWGL